MNSRFKAALSTAVAAVMAFSMTACSDTGAKQEEASGEFTPKLDTEKAVMLDIAGFFGNFEALDQVENDFNEYYPNVVFSYEQIGATNIDEYIANNSYTDIFMTSDDNVRFPGLSDKYVGNRCADLAAAGVDTSAFSDEMLRTCYVDGKLLRVPMAQHIYGMAVNVTLLKKEGLSVPQNYSEFTAVLKTLKDKGYTPIQGPVNRVYSELIMNMADSIIGNDKELQDALYSGDESAVQKMRPVFERLQDIVDNGWTDLAVNQTYPDDNYDHAILSFFEGDVPFWICDTEKVSGMKKRESKSEAFSSSPFEYRFMFIPLGDNGFYEYREPWFGFSVNKDSEDFDYAAEFVRFLATETEINKMAEIKGVPFATETKAEGIYSIVSNPKNVQLSFINDGAIKPHITSFLGSKAKALGTGEISSAEEAAKQFVQECSTVSRED